MSADSKVAEQADMLTQLYPGPKQHKNSSWKEARSVTGLALKGGRRAETHWDSPSAAATLPQLSSPHSPHRERTCLLGVNIFKCDSLTLYKQKSVVKYSKKYIVESRTGFKIPTAIITHLKIHFTRKMQTLSKKIY